jgi:hypothetical protein
MLGLANRDGQTPQTPYRSQVRKHLAAVAVSTHGTPPLSSPLWPDS